MIDIPLRVVAVEDPARAQHRARLRTAVFAVLAFFAVFLMAVAAARPEVIVVRAPRVTSTRVDVLTDTHAVKRPSPVCVADSAPVAATPHPARAPRLTPRGVAPASGIVRVAPF
jgi:hypothetical protein